MMTIDTISNLIPPANPQALPVSWLSPRPEDGERPPRDRETTEVRLPEEASTSSWWPRVFPGL
jgi:hypothetical protein